MFASQRIISAMGAHQSLKNEGNNSKFDVCSSDFPRLSHFDGYTHHIFRQTPSTTLRNPHQLKSVGDSSTQYTGDIWGLSSSMECGTATNQYKGMTKGFQHCSITTHKLSFGGFNIGWSLGWFVMGKWNGYTVPGKPGRKFSRLKTCSLQGQKKKTCTVSIGCA